MSSSNTRARVHSSDPCLGTVSFTFLSAIVVFRPSRGVFCPGASCLRKLTGTEPRARLLLTNTVSHLRYPVASFAQANALTSVLMVVLVRIIAASIAFSHSTAISTSDNGDAGENLHDNDVNDEGHILSGGPEQPAASRDFEPVAEARPSNSTRGGGNSGRKRSLEGTDNSASSATNAEGDRHEGPVGHDGETL